MVILAVRGHVSAVAVLIGDADEGDAAIQGEVERRQRLGCLRERASAAVFRAAQGEKPLSLFSAFFLFFLSRLGRAPTPKQREMEEKEKWICFLCISLAKKAREEGNKKEKKYLGKKRGQEKAPNFVFSSVFVAPT